MITSSTVNPRIITNRSSITAAMAGSVDDLGAVGPAPPDSWEVADLDATMSRLRLSSKRDTNNNSDSTSTASLPPSEFSTDATTPDRSSSGGVLENLVNTVDQFLREALQNPRERLSVLRMEQDVEKFIRDPSQQQMEFQQLPTSYLRLAAHRVAQHYSLQSMVLLDNTLPDGSGSRIIVRKTSESRLPLIRLADIPVNIPTEDLSGSVAKVAIKQRPNKRSQVSGANSNSLKSNSLKSVEERKEEYNRARARIFSSSSSSGVTGVKQENEPRMQEAFQHNTLGTSKVEEVSVPDVSTGRTSVDYSAGSSRSGRSRTEEEPIVRSRSNSRVAIFRDREVERKDPDYDRNYDRYAQRFDPGFGFNGGSYPIQPLYTPVINYNTEFPQLGSAHRSPPISAEHQSRPLPQHLPGPWVAPSSPAGIGYRPPDAMMTPFSPNHMGPHSASTLYMQYPCQRPGMTFIHPREQVHQHYAQSQQQQSDASFGLARPR